MTPNQTWHEAHPMPRNASLAERVDWHVDHAKQCGCRPIPSTVRGELARRRRSSGR